MDLAGALDLGADELVAFVGAGGKKTAMGQLVSEAGARSVGYTTTTHMPPPGDIPLVLSPPDTLVATLQSQGTPISFAHHHVRNPERVTAKVRGFDPSVLDRMADADLFDWLLVKADGARQRSFKAPAGDEPAIPSTSTAVVVIASVQVVDKELTTEVVHRPERVAELAGIGVGETLGAASVARALASERGGLKGIPDRARGYVILNQADTVELRETAAAVVDEIFEQTDRFEKALITSFRREHLEVSGASGRS